ncbi:MAG: hypothetical protein JWN70_6619 [Planctomycetaceae bacterium]|nr:hypothetical protein [Planctomycetaceae bacterium]
MLADADVMLMANLSRHHSAEVHLSLITASGTYRLSQIGPHYLVVAKPENLPPCDGEIVMRVDGAEDRWLVRLVEGINAANRKAAIDPR